jgi:hypothetical protein
MSIESRLGMALGIQPPESRIFRLRSSGAIGRRELPRHLELKDFLALRSGKIVRISQANFLGEANFSLGIPLA